LEIPIPHYRLGKPHFSVQGTPALRSSAYTRTSEGMSEKLKSIPAVKNDFLSPESTAAKSRGLSKSHSSDTFLNPSGTIIDLSRDPAGAADFSTSDSYRQPINPEVFDKLATFKDDASVVRYSQRTGAITAATPARIVAQISSEAFMDYDLVSDFFLTFRAYLSTENLLSLLLARLRWAINRLEDDGRIIRIRTFAALRHWILNYFVDDFVVNRKLRVQFCDQINEMYHEVSQRTGGGVSDLKILLDLKRCWNGRCSLYWDSGDFVVDTQQAADIVPGGVLGSRDASLTQLEVLIDQASKSSSNAHPENPSAAKTWYGQPPPARGPKLHHKQVSASTVGVPVSPTSEQSLQPISCSIPAGAFKRSPPPEGNARGPYPVSVQLRKSDSPTHPPTSIEESHRRLSYAHKRSVSTSDSVRDRSSTDSESRPLFLLSPHSGSLIRGNVYPPAAPFVDVIAPESPPNHISRLNVSSTGMSASLESGGKSALPANPGVKTLMGSIRRALSSKQAVSTSTSSVEEVSRSTHSLRGKTSGLPLNMARSTDTLRDKKSAPATRHHLRIDLLCAAVSQSYQMAQAKASQESFVSHGLGVSISDIREDSGSQQSLGSRDFSIEAGDVQHILNQDAVGPGSTIMSDAAGLDLSNTKMALETNAQGEVLVADFDFTTAGMMSMPLLYAERKENRRDSSVEDHRRSSSVDTALARRSKDQGHLQEAEPVDMSKGARISPKHGVLSRQRQGLRVTDSASTSSQDHDPTQGAAQPQAPRPSLDLPAASFWPKEAELDFKPGGPAHTLRRRPGGNLRNIENVHDLAPSLRRQSTGSVTTRSESVASMLVIGSNRAHGSKQKKPMSRAPQHPVSMLRTHSSQHLRPSFEAAISGFSTIPDDDDGGLEATLLKLEGRYERLSPDMINDTRARIARKHTATSEGSSRIEDRYNSYDQAAHSKSDLSPVSSRLGNPRLRQPGSVSRARKRNTKSVSTRSGRSKSSAANSEGSYSSIPLLERGLIDESMRKPKVFQNSISTIPPPIFEKQPCTGAEQDSTSSHPSIELIEKTDSVGRIPKGSTIPHPPAPSTDGSFLLDEDDNLTDLSSEMSVDVIDHSEVNAPIVSSLVAPECTEISGHALPTHPLAHPPSPAFSFHHAVTSVPATNPMMYQQKPLTPQPSPTQGDMPQGSQVRLSQILPRRKSAAVASATVTTSSGHIPFVLACESEVLAQQLTLVEKAALSEIEWSDLVEMKWDNKSPNILNWVEYLAAKDNRGIDIVITRFNIVVKWAISEIVMTQNIHERSQAITKYIHIAGHARQIHNYATMLQITIALTSIDCTRLKATWELVPDPEKALLKEMETLIQPIRNFHELRIEMETANLQDGCIPFVGMYNLSV
jgi:RasGEF domain/RasGEF N-terminal motif